jgi:Holliday junction resolvase RusA-like endonuclease
MRLFLPYPPSANARLTMRKGGKGFVNTAKYRTWMDHAAWVVVLGMRDPRYQKIIGPYRLDMIAMPPLRSQVRDLDNIVKATSDALKKGGAIEDDRFCQKLTLAWGGLDEAGILVEIEPCANRLLLVGGSDKSTTATAKSRTRPRSHRAATTLVAKTGDDLDTANPDNQVSGSPLSFIPADDTACPKRRKGPKT